MHLSSVASLLSELRLPAGCGLLYLLCWPLYVPGWPWSAALCASVPALATLHFVLVGSGLQNDQELVRSFSVRPDAKVLHSGCMPAVKTAWTAASNSFALVLQRQGEQSELLLGPAPYG